MPLMLLNPAGVCPLCKKGFSARRAGQVTVTVYSPAGQAHKLAFCRPCAGEASGREGERRMNAYLTTFFRKHPGWSEGRRGNPERPRRHTVRDVMTELIPFEGGWKSRGDILLENKRQILERGGYTDAQAEKMADQWLFNYEQGLARRNIRYEDGRLLTSELEELIPFLGGQEQRGRVMGELGALWGRERLRGVFQSQKLAMNFAHNLLRDENIQFRVQPRPSRGENWFEVWTEPSGHAKIDPQSMAISEYMAARERIKDRKGNPMTIQHNPRRPTRENPTPLRITNTEIHTWFERNRAHVELRDKTLDRTIVEWWDEDVQQAVEDGFLDPYNWHQSAYDYAVHLGLIENPFPGEHTGIGRGRAGNPVGGLYWVLRKDGKIQYAARTEAEALGWFHRQHSYSWLHGQKHEGWTAQLERWEPGTKGRPRFQRFGPRYGNPRLSWHTQSRENYFFMYKLRSQQAAQLRRDGQEDQAALKDAEAKTFFGMAKAEDLAIKKEISDAKAGPHIKNPGEDWHRQRYGSLMSEFRRFQYSEPDLARYYRGAAEAEEVDLTEEEMRRMGQSLRRNPTPLAGFRKFHGADPNKARRVQVPVGWPRKLWMLGRLELLKLDTGEEIRGGAVAAGSGNRIYLLNVTMPARLTPGARATQIEYVTPSCSERAGPVWFHPFDRPPQVVSCGRGFLTLAGKGLKLTRQGIVG